MSSSHDLSGLMKFIRRPEWADAFDRVLDEHVGMALQTLGLEDGDVPDLIGDHGAANIWGCAFEDFLTRQVAPDGRNIVEDYLKRSGLKESAHVRRYMTALRSSFMSLYEVSDIVPGTSFKARDLLLEGEPVLVHEKSATQTLQPWDRIGARLVDLGERTVIGGGLLPFGHDVSDALLRGLGGSEVDDPGHAGPMPPVERDDLRRAAPLFTTSWLLEILEKALGALPQMVNSDGEEPVLHQFRYPLAKGIRQKDLTPLLNAVHVLRPVRSKIWDWLDEREIEDEAAVNGESGPVTEALSIDGRVILGHVELEGRTLILSTGSVSRAERATRLLRETLGDRLLEPAVRIERLDDIDDVAFAGAGSTLEDDTGLPPEIETSLVHRLLDGQYRRTLDEPVPMLGGLSPRAAAADNATRKDVADWLKYLENQGGQSALTTDPMESYDFTWMWIELGLQDLRR